MIKQIGGTPNRHKAVVSRALRQIALGLTVVAGCAAGSATSPAAANDLQVAAGGTGKPEKADINFGYQQTADHAPLVLGIKKGFFKDEGLTLHLHPLVPVNVVAAVVSGDLDIDNITWIQYLTAGKQGIRLSLVAETDRSAPNYADYVVRSDSPIKKPEDLLGKKVGVVQANGVCDFLFDDTLKSEGLAYDSVRYATIPVPNLVSTLLSGGADAVCLPEPFLTPALESSKVRKLFDLFSGAHDDWPITTYGVTAAFAAKNPNTIGALQRALAKSRAYANAHPDEAREILTTYTSIKPEVAKKMVLPSYPAKGDTLDGLQRTKELLQRLNVLPGGSR